MGFSGADAVFSIERKNERLELQVTPSVRPRGQVPQRSNQN